jgi:hypothetical protein
MRRLLLYMMGILLLLSCQHELHFPPAPPAVVVPHEKSVAAIVITNPTQSDYDSLVFRYSTDKTREVHYNPQGDSVTRTYYYDAAGRLSKLEDEKAIYYTNNNMARRISFHYDAGGRLQETVTDFINTSGITASAVYGTDGANKQMTVYDTAYTGAGYNLDWVNRIIYSTISNNNYLLYDSGIFINTTTAGLVKTIVNVYSYAADSSVTSISKRIYFNHQLSEYGTVSAKSDHAAPAYLALRKKLYRNLSNWFETGLAWQDDNYHLFPLPGGPYVSILYQGLSTGGAQPYTRNFDYNNQYGGDQLDKSVVDYTLLGQGTGHYTNVLRFYYKE